MIKQIKFGLQIMGYGHGMKTGIIFVLIMVLSGVVGLICAPSSWFGAYFVFAGAMWPTQLLYSFNTSDMIMSSPMGKKLQTSVTAYVGTVFYIISMILVCVIRIVQVNMGMLETNVAGAQIFISSFIILGLMLYLAVALKYFIASTIFFIVFVYALMGGSYFIIPIVAALNINVVIMTILSLVITLLSGFAYYGVTLLLYKKPVAKRSQLAGLKKAM